MARVYQIHAFAELAGVTVKALHHYDRLGLLKPRRNDTGYRLYSERDLERLEQIVALRFLGVPLKQIKAVLDRPALELSEVLRMQRRAMEEKHALTARAIQAIRQAEAAIEPGKSADPAIFKQIIGVIEMQNGIEAMKKYYSEEAWEKRRSYYEEGPSQEWRDFYRDANALLDEDPAGEKAQALGERWLALQVRAWSGDLKVQTDSPLAWKERENWPPAMKQRLAEFNVEKVTAFMQQAGLLCRKRYYSEEAWKRLLELRTMTRETYTVFWQAHLDLFHDVLAAIGTDPAGESGQALAARWRAQMESDSGGDPGVREGLARYWSDRKNWPALLRWQVESLHRMPFEQFEAAADYIDAAVSTQV